MARVCVGLLVYFIQIGNEEVSVAVGTCWL